MKTDQQIALIINLFRYGNIVRNQLNEKQNDMKVISPSAGKNVLGPMFEQISIHILPHLQT